MSCCFRFSPGRSAIRWTVPRIALLALLALSAGCGRPSPAVPPAPTNFAAPVADLLAELATTALQADARLEPADSLYGPDVEIIAEGRRRTAPPRYAGIDTGGQIAVGSTRVDVTGNFAWALVEYRWLAPDQNLLREGRATFVFARAAGTGQWRITHAHSSTIP
jgi:hypothetical protein